MWPWGTPYESERGNFCDSNCPEKRWNHTGYDDGYALSSPTGSFPGGASPYGALVMAGNVWEWVADWYGEHYDTQSAAENPDRPVSGKERMQRGGSWHDNEAWVRTTVRHAAPPGTRADDLGFRCSIPAISPE